MYFFYALIVFSLVSCLDLTVTLSAERERLQNGLEQRVFFDNNNAGEFPSVLPNTVSATSGNQECITRTAYIQVC